MLPPIIKRNYRNKKEKAKTYSSNKRLLIIGHKWSCFSNIHIHFENKTTFNNQWNKRTYEEIVLKATYLKLHGKSIVNQIENLNKNIMAFKISGH